MCELAHLQFATDGHYVQSMEEHLIELGAKRVAEAAALAERETLTSYPFPEDGRWQWLVDLADSKEHQQAGKAGLAAAATLCREAAALKAAKESLAAAAAAWAHCAERGRRCQPSRRSTTRARPVASLQPPPHLACPLAVLKAKSIAPGEASTTSAGGSGGSVGSVSAASAGSKAKAAVAGKKRGRPAKTAAADTATEAATASASSGASGRRTRARKA